MKNLILLLLATLTFTGCADKWQLSGKINGSKGETVYVQNSSSGLWLLLDSAVTDNDGNFTIRHQPAGHPDVYRLTYGDNVIYFPIDSIENVTLTASKANFANDYLLSGSSDAELFTTVDHKIARSADAAAGDSLLKRELSEIILANPASLTAYYIITRQVTGKQIFNPENRRDLSIIGAVANAFSEQLPSDPRTKYLTDLFLKNKKAQSGKVLYADEAPLVDINLRDENGKEQSLKKLSESGIVIILNFTAYDAEESPAFNIELNKVYERYKSQGLEIYQVAVDVDDIAWRQSANNLPWITVRNPQADGAQNLLNYNVQTIPTTYIINRKGELVKRVDDIWKLNQEVAKVM